MMAIIKLCKRKTELHQKWSKMAIFMLPSLRKSQNLTDMPHSKVKVIAGERLHFTDIMSGPYSKTCLLKVATQK